MKLLNATCPQCAHQFKLNEVLEKEIQTIVENRSKSEIQSKEGVILNLKREMESMENEFRDKTKLTVSQEVSKALKAQEAQLSKDAQANFDLVQDQLKVANKKLQEAQQNELSLRKKSIEVENKERELSLEVERKVSTQVTELKQNLTKQITDDFHRKDTERENLISDLRKQIVEMKYKTEQGSQQAQGESFEIEVRSQLINAFPQDTIIDVPKGVSGADIVQTVVSLFGAKCGKILWELKQSKAFQPIWIDKLREDRNAMGAELAILVSQVLPKGKKGAYLDQGIWVVEPAVALCVASITRQSLIELHQATLAMEARHDKADILYCYLTNPVFRQRLEAIVESFHQMREDLEREKRAISKTWKQRERQLDVVVENTVHIYSDIQAVVGQKVLSIQKLELPGGEHNGV